ncbi:hypothetical protein [Kitasatospora sp. NPDC088351]|uniref:hypothetical protein n=1 Tax=unclassified Kitasatospora TaxID=2633591 RepID=UPI00343C9795
MTDHQPNVPPPPRRPPTTPWAAAPRAGGPEPAAPATGRLRRIVDRLPDWEPLPPGEALVRRPGSAS